MSKHSKRSRAALLGAVLCAIALALAAPVLAAALYHATAKTPHTKPPPAPKPPAASTGSATDVADSSAALNGVVNPHGAETSCYFQYGTSAAYGAQTPTTPVGAGTTGVKVSQPLTGLQLGTVYHYRLVAVSANGTADGENRTLTTAKIALRFVIEKGSQTDVFGSPFTVSGTLTGTGGAGHQVVLQADPFPYLGAFSDVGAPQSTNAAGGFALHVPSVSIATKLRVRTLDPLPVYSPVLTERVAVRVTLHVRPAGGLGMERLQGTVEPAVVGAQVALQRMRSVRGPVNAGTTLTRRGSARFARFSAVVLIRHSGDYRALVRVANGKQVSGFSRTVYLRGAPTYRLRRS
jgi:hypothetical protein